MTINLLVFSIFKNTDITSKTNYFFSVWEEWKTQMLLNVIHIVCNVWSNSKALLQYFGMKSAITHLSSICFNQNFGQKIY